MFFEMTVWSALKPFLWLIPVFMVAGFLKSSTGKGLVGEWLVMLVARFRLDKETYHRFHNVTLPTVDGTTQIDHVLVSKYGIFVVETKNMKGWIFGSERDSQWTQSIYKHKSKFQNPLRQNLKHTKALEAALDVPADKVHSIITFVGDATLKTEMPANVTRGAGFIDYVKRFQQRVFTDAEVAGLVARLQTGRLKPGLATHVVHVQNLRARDDVDAAQVCPTCGSALVVRTVSRGDRAGQRFWGCSTYPKCRYTRGIN